MLPITTEPSYQRFDARVARRERAVARGGGVPKKIARLDTDEKISGADKARIILGLRQHHKLATLLDATGLARSTFYYQGQALQRADKHCDMKTQICTIYTEHKGRYGYRRITAALCNSMVQPVNHKRVQRLMQHLGLQSLIRAKKRYRHTRGLNDVHVPNVLRRDFHATAPARKWVTDITEFNVKGHKLYLSACMDLYNRRDHAHRMARRPVFELGSSTLDAAIPRCEAAGLILHSDQGWQYKMQPYRAKLGRYGITQSMSRKGDCFDNAVIESFFGTLKAEFFHLAKFDSLVQLEAGINDYIRYYNYERIKLGLQGLSPVGTD